MFRRIMVPIQGSARDAESIAIARQLASQSGAQIVLLHAQPDSAAPDAAAVSSSALAHLADVLRADGEHVLVQTEHGAPSHAIAQTATAQRSEVIVLTPERRGFLATLRRPSVTAQMFSRTPAPLLIWPDRSQDNPPAKAADVLETPNSLVIVPLDGSALAEGALPLAEAFAREYRRPLLLVRVVPRVPILGGEPDMAMYASDVQEASEREAFDYLRHVRHCLERAPESRDLHVQTMLRVGDPARELATLAEAHPDSLLVMTTHGRSPVRRLLAGSVAMSLFKRVSIPMLVVPPTMQCEESARDSDAR